MKELVEVPMSPFDVVKGWVVGNRQALVASLFGKVFQLSNPSPSDDIIVARTGRIFEGNQNVLSCTYYCTCYCNESKETNPSASIVL